MHTEFWKRVAAFGVWRFGEKKPIEFGSENQVQKRNKSEEEWMLAPYAERESKRRSKAQATIKYSLMVELGWGIRQDGTLPDEQVMGFQF
jgi:hypothetical protein